MITLIFEGSEVIYTQGGALVHCPPAEVRLSDIGQNDDIYDVIPVNEARFLVECMMVEDRNGMAA